MYYSAVVQERSDLTKKKCFFLNINVNVWATLQTDQITMERCGLSCLPHLSKLPTMSCADRYKQSPKYFSRYVANPRCYNWSLERSWLGNEKWTIYRVSWGHKCQTHYHTSGMYVCDKITCICIFGNVYFLVPLSIRDSISAKSH